MQNNQSDIKITTKEIEQLAYTYLSKMGTYLCFEVGIPTKYRGAYTKERVDLLSYDTKDIWRFYEIKITKSDFHSKNKNSFYGHYNYYIMPNYVYEEVMKDIPNHVGVYIVYRHKNGHCYMTIEKNPKKQELGLDSNKLMFNFMQALSREYGKYRKLIKGGKDI